MIFKMLQTSGFKIIFTLLMYSKLQVSFVCNNCCNATFNDAAQADPAGEKQIDNLVIYQGNIWNKVVFSKKKLLHVSPWHNLKGQYRAEEIQ